MNGEVWNYVYNSENQMIEASYYEGTTKIKTVSFFYDAFGRRVKKAVESFQNNSISERRYAYDSNEIIAELDENNNVLATYTHSGLRTDDVLSAKISSDGVSRGLAYVPGSYTYLKDGLGSVQAIVNESGHLVQRYIYSSFGKLLKTVDAIGLETTAIKTAFSFTNRETDEETGLHYYRARYYSPNIGRFLQEDPFEGFKEEPVSIFNRYGYVWNSPTNYIDPNGKFPWNSFYGRYCGWFRTGPGEPVSRLDQSCRDHDNAYANQEKASTINDVHVASRRLQTDVDLIKNGLAHSLRNLDDPAEFGNGIATAAFGTVFTIWSFKAYIATVTLKAFGIKITW